MHLEVDGQYRFRLSSVNGSRMYVNGEIFLDQLEKDEGGFLSKQETLNAGIYDIQILYYDTGGIAFLKIDY